MDKPFVNLPVIGYTADQLENLTFDDLQNLYAAVMGFARHAFAEYMSLISTGSLAERKANYAVFSAYDKAEFHLKRMRDYVQWVNLPIRHIF